MGVGLPFGLGAKAAKPDAQVLVLHGDGSFGLNAMELDTAVRWKLPVVTVVSLNGGWTADPDREQAPGRDLGYTRYDKMAEALGCHGEYVEDAGWDSARVGAGVRLGHHGAGERQDGLARPRDDGRLLELHDVGFWKLGSRFWGDSWAVAE